MENIELKARLNDFEAAVAAAQALGAEDRGDLQQEDTYFHSPSGRLKIRRIGGAAAGELIAYQRANQSEARSCEYDVVQVLDAPALCRALGRVLGIRTIVRKVRRLFLWKNVRIHLDRVENLGDFLEFEAVLRDGADAEEAKRDLAFLSAKFSIKPGDLLTESYGEMILRQEHRSKIPASESTNPHEPIA